nr:uncharacterized protein si:ch211-170d8.2 [Nerophis lumbriciformis]
MAWMLLVCSLAVFTTNSIGGLCRALGAHGSKDESWALRADALMHRDHRDHQDHRERCADLTANWLHNSRVQAADKSTVLHLSVRPASAGASRGSVFPEQPLFSLVRRVYRCCQEAGECRSVRGLQGGFLAGGPDVEFLLSRDVLFLSVRRVELHLQLSNPQHVNIQPVLPLLANKKLPTRFISRSQGDTTELRVDLLFFFQRLQAAAAGGPGGGRGLAKMMLPSPRHQLQDDQQHGVWGEMGVALGCSREGVPVTCQSGQVRLLHSPFLAVYYR